MLPKTGLRVLDAGRCVVDEIYAASKRARRPWPGAAQLRDAAESIVANISEGFGRAEGPDRIRFLVIARGSAEEANERLRVLFAAKRIEPGDYWRLHHRLVAIARMLTSLMARIAERMERDATASEETEPRRKASP